MYRRLTRSLVMRSRVMRERFERVGVDMLRTLLARENTLLLSFFRSQGMTAGRLIPLEIRIGDAP